MKYNLFFCQHPLPPGVGCPRCLLSRFIRSQICLLSDSIAVVFNDDILFHILQFLIFSYSEVRLYYILSTVDSNL